MPNILHPEFFLRDTREVARELLGKRLIVVSGDGLNSVRQSGIITETEAYRGTDDPASHAHS